jgi:hypothetical protein
MKQLVADIISSLEREPERWTIAYYTWQRDDGIEVWRANLPILNISLYRPVGISFSLSQKVRLWLAFRKWRNMVSLEWIKGNMS